MTQKSLISTPAAAHQRRPAQQRRRNIPYAWPDGDVWTVRWPTTYGTYHVQFIGDEAVLLTGVRRRPAGVKTAKLLLPSALQAIEHARMGAGEAAS